MSSLGNDSYWLDAKNFLKAHLQPTEKTIAPARYRRELPNAEGYDVTDKRAAEEVDWVLVHKGMVPQIESIFLRQTIATLQPVFANEVFVIFAKRQIPVPDLDRLKLHLQPLLQTVDPQRSVQLDRQKRSRWVDRLVRPLKRAVRTSTQVNEMSHQLNLMKNQMNQLDRKLSQIQQERKTLPVYSPTRLAALSLAELRTACRSACQTAYLGNETVLCRVLTRYLLYGDTQDVGVVPHLCLNGYWEGGVTLAMARLLQPGWFCIDVGANAGYYSLLMAGAVGKEGRVVAIEPNPKLVNLLNKTLDVNGFQSWATVLPKAVSDRSGETVQLSVPPSHPGNGTIVGRITASDTVYATETMTIDQLTENWERVDLIKIDAEGAEAQIWQGMRQTIRRHPQIQIVLEFGTVRYADPQAFLQEIQAEGFVLRYVDGDTGLKEISIDRLLTEQLDCHWDLFLSRR